MRERAEELFHMSNRQMKPELVNDRNKSTCSIGIWKRKYDIDIEPY